MPLQTFAPEYRHADAQRSGFLQCPECGLVWFGMPGIEGCPGEHSCQPVRVAVLCRKCDFAIPIERMVEHLTSDLHVSMHRENPVTVAVQ
jgi:hypothetical protein